MTHKPKRSDKVSGSPLRKAHSSPSIAGVDRFADPQPFPEELAARAARYDAETPERWMCIVVRREKINHAVGRIVHVGRIQTKAVG
ncbi:hypothetical protein K443DRAFT_6095 [Laccaria amethystina LaAM-08-1]|uniref:Uncharacterized protein n=1 Tax=Laccaria amethystina LaAM-08-1 TaxID=1095629 RepID=A0A0C9Y2Z4_9AGAR|nr:hypothetical protein K443DRAFT_6095 [Laccaria amethystina LaAM-08-1]